MWVTLGVMCFQLYAQLACYAHQNAETLTYSRTTIQPCQPECYPGLTTNQLLQQKAANPKSRQNLAMFGSAWVILTIFKPGKALFRQSSHLFVEKCRNFANFANFIAQSEPWWYLRRPTVCPGAALGNLCRGLS